MPILLDELADRHSLPQEPQAVPAPQPGAQLEPNQELQKQAKTQKGQDERQEQHEPALALPATQLSLPAPQLLLLDPQATEKLGHHELQRRGVPPMQ